MSRSAAMNHSLLPSVQLAIPPSAIIHVGAGLGVGKLHQWRQHEVEYAWLIDAEPCIEEWAQDLLSTHPNWHAITATVGQDEAEVQFYRASNGAESGLLDPSNLRLFWPNLSTLEQSTRPTQSLDKLIGQASLGQQHLWLIIDCLPALPILQGASALLQQASVLWLRAVLPTDANLASGCTQTDLLNYLAPLGFACAAICETNHPAIAEILYVRNWRGLAQQHHDTLTQSSGEISRLQLENAVHLEEISSNSERLTVLMLETATIATEKSELAKRYTELQAQVVKEQSTVKALTQTHEDLTQQMQALQLDSQQWQAERQLFTGKQEQQELELVRLQQQLAEQTKIAKDAELQLVQAKNTALEAINDQVGQFQATQATWQQERTLLQEQENQLHKQLAELQQLMETKDARFLQLEQKNWTLTNQLTQLQSEKDTWIATGQQELVALQQRYEELRQREMAMGEQHQALQKTSAEQQLTLTSQRDTIDTLKREQLEHAAKIESLTREASSNSGERVDSHKKMALLVERLTKAEDEKLASLKERDVLAAQLEQAKALAAQTAQRSQELHDELAASKAASSNAEQLQAELSKTKDHDQHLQKQLKTVSEERDTVIKSLRMQQAASEVLNAQMAKREQEQQQLQQEKAALLEQHAQLQQTLAEISAEREAMRQQVATIDEHLARSAKESELRAQLQQQLQLASEQQSAVESDKQMLTTQLQALERSLKEQSQQLQEVQQHEQQMSLELVRAEAQIELIKDVLLREQGL